MSNKLQKDIQYEAIFKQYYRQLFHYIFRYVNNMEIAADIANDVFCYLWEKYDQLDLDISPLPWLYTVARNYSIDYLRHKEVEHKNKLNLQKSDLYDSSMKDIMEHELKINEIMQRIELLPPQTQKVFNECFVNKRKYKEVAEELGISVNTVKTLLLRALRFLRGKKK